MAEELASISWFSDVWGGVPRSVVADESVSVSRSAGGFMRPRPFPMPRPMEFIWGGPENEVKKLGVSGYPKKVYPTTKPSGKTGGF